MPRPKITEERTAQILDAAAAVIAERGICAARVSDIAERLDISPALVLYYFPSKDALLGAALARRDQQFFAHVAEVASSRPDAWSRLVTLISASCPGRTNGTDAMEIEDWDLWVEAWSRSRHDPDLAASRARMDALFRDTIAEIVRSGVEQGDFAHDDPAAFALLLTSLIDGLAIQVLLGDEAVDRAVMIELCTTLAARELGVAHAGLR